MEGGEGGSGDETTAKKVITFQRMMNKKVVSFFRKKYKNRATPSVASRGDINLSDATAQNVSSKARDTAAV